MRPHVRRGLTLIELLVVCAIIVTLLGLVAAVTPRLGDRQRSSRGASQFQTWLNISRSRAIRDQRPSGVRLIPPTGPFSAQYVRECQYVETPPDFTGGTVQVPYDNDANALNDNGVPQPGLPANRYKFVLLRDVELPLTGNVAVQPGDILDLYEIYPNQPRRIVGIQAMPANPPKFPVAHFLIKLDAELGGTYSDFDDKPPVSPTCTQSRKPTYTDHASYDPLTKPTPDVNYPTSTTPPYKTTPPFTKAYRIYRQPRPLPGEPLLQFPKDVAIDISRDPTADPRWYRFYPKLGNTGGGGPLDILFDPSGRVVGGIGFNADSAVNWIAPTVTLNTNRICMWVREVSKNYDDSTAALSTRVLPEGDNTIVTVYTRTGLNAAHPVATSRTDPNGQSIDLLNWTASGNNPWNPFYLTQDARSSGQ